VSDGTHATRRANCDCAASVGEHPDTPSGQGPGQQPGDLHLGHSNVDGDLGRGHIAEEERRLALLQYLSTREGSGAAAGHHRSALGLFSVSARRRM